MYVRHRDPLRTPHRRATCQEREGVKPIFLPSKQDKRPTSYPTLFELVAKQKLKRKGPDPFSSPLEQHGTALQIAAYAETTTYAHPPVASQRGPTLHAPPEISALLESLTGVMVAQTCKGVSTTTFTLTKMPFFSPFIGSQIEINHYDTAPHSFQIQLLGTPQAVSLFETHLASLQQSLQQTLPRACINLLPPILLPTERLYSSRRKRKVSSLKHVDHTEEDRSPFRVRRGCSKEEAYHF